MKNILKLFMLFSLINTAGCSNKATINDNRTKESYKTSSYITNEIRRNSEKGNLEASMLYEYTPELLYEKATDIAIVKVISIASADMDFANIIPTTYGTMLINTALSGDINENSIINYARPGGIVSVSEYEKHDEETAIKKREYLRNKAGVTIDKNNTYYEIYLDNDIELETGKTYLAYMKYHSNSNTYEILGFENGLREINLPVQSRSVKKDVLQIEDLKLKNNHTNTYESLSEYVNKYIHVN